MSSRSILANFFWRFAERVGAQLVKLIVSIIIARILSPSDYGVVALITVFTSILQVFVDSGLGNALIQKKNADNLDFSTVFFVNIIFCVGLYALLFASSPLIASFYDNLQLVPYIRVLGLTVLISGIKNVQQAYVSRNMMFKKFFFSTLGGTIIAGIISVFLALNGMGAWALVAQQVINLAIDTIILWITVSWRPQLVFSIQRLKGLFSYGWKLLASQLLSTIYDEIWQLLIGKVYSSADLAFYNQGKQFPTVISNNINSSIDSVLLPAMSDVQDNREKVKAMTRKSMKISIYLMAPLMMGMAFVSRTLVAFILTDKWFGAVFFMQIFCITFMFYPLHTANLNAIKAIGRSDIYLKLEIVKKIVGIIVLISTMFVSVEALAVGMLVLEVLGQIINTYPNKKLLGYGYLEQLKDILPTILLAFVMGVIIFPIQFIGLSYSLTLFIQILFGAVIYILGSEILHLDSFEYLLGVVKPYIEKIVKR